MKFFITGAAGHLGQAICTKLISENNNVVGFDLIDSPIKQKNYHHLIGNIIDEKKITQALIGCDCMIHLAVLTGVDYNEYPMKAFESNVFGTFILYENIRKIGNIKTILISSAPVDKQLLQSDNSLIWRSDSGNDHAYDLTKRLQEEIARDYSETFGVQSIILRIGHVVDGAHEIDLNGNSLSNLKYCLGGWVDKNDVANACLLAANFKKNKFEIFNIIGSYQGQKLFDVKRTNDLLGWQPEYAFLET